MRKTKLHENISQLRLRVVFKIKQVVEAPIEPIVEIKELGFHVLFVSSEDNGEVSSTFFGNIKQLHGH